MSTLCQAAASLVVLVAMATKRLINLPVSLIVKYDVLVKGDCACTKSNMV